MARKASADPTPPGDDTTGPRSAHPEGQTRAGASSRGKGRTGRQQEHQSGEDSEEIASSLSFREAQAALELCLAQLQASDLDVERMAELYRRAEFYARRCEQLLDQVEQDVMQWDPEGASTGPQPLHD